VQILNTIVHLPQCDGNHTLERLLLAENDIDNPDFLTLFKKDHWVVVDGRGRRDSSKAHYENFCLDRYYHGTRHLGTIALICEQSEESYCRENDCFQHCCLRNYYLDETSGDCIEIDYYQEEAKWLNFNASKQIDNLDFTELTNIFGKETCEEGDLPIKFSFREHDIKYLPYGEIDIDGARVPFGKHCYARQGNHCFYFNLTFVKRKGMLERRVRNSTNERLLSTFC
jgi:hypothetical protein